MKSFSKRVASFTMAAAMVLSLAAVSPVDAEAATAKITKKSSITAGKTYTYNVKNVTKSQYIKVRMSSGVTVKYNNKTVKKGSTKINGGKTIALKVKAADKVANYKATVKAVIYNKKNNKKVKTLTTQSTVKCTKLAITSVESATLPKGANSIKYLVVKFNRTIDALDASEVEIRDANTERLSTVGKVTLAKNGKSATIELLGEENTSVVNYLNPLTDYVMTITKDSVTASLKFNIEGVMYDVVSTVNVDKKTINGLTVPASLTVDYADILGRTVTCWYDKDSVITKMNLANETPIYGAFKAVSTNIAGIDSAYVTLVNKADGTVKYAEIEDNDRNTSNWDTAFINANGNGPKTVTSGNSLNYTKIFLNPNGTIKSAVVADPTLVYQTTSISNTTVRESATASKNLKDYTILKDGKKITVDAIATNDVVFTDDIAKVADVYTSKVEGVVTKVTTEKVTIGDKQYKYANAKYLDGDQTKIANEDYFINLKTAAKTATIWLDRAGDIVRASGEQGTPVTNTKEYVLTGATKNYAQANQHYIQLTGSNGKDTSIPVVAVENLTSYVVSGDTFKVSSTSANNAAKVYSVKSFAADSSWGATNNDGATVSANVLAGQTTYTTPFDLTPNNDFVDGRLVKVTTNDKGVVVGIEAVSSNRGYVSTNAAFKAGLTTVKADDNKDYQIKSTVTVYEISTVNGAAVVTATPYASFAKTTEKSKNNTLVSIYRDGGNVTAVIIDNRDSKNAYGVADDATAKGIILDVANSKDKVCDLTILTTSGEKVFTAFDNVASNAGYVKGAVVSVKYVSASNTVKSINVETKSNGNIAVSTNSMAVVDNNIIFADNAKYTLSTSENPVIVKVANGSVEVIDYSALQQIKNDATTDSAVEVYELSTGIVNFIVVKKGL